LSLREAQKQAHHAASQENESAKVKGLKVPREGLRLDWIEIEEDGERHDGYTAGR
jgi:hypothetical protein